MTNNQKIIKDVVWSIEDLERLSEYYQLEYQRTNNTYYEEKRVEINQYLKKYKEIANSLTSSIEIRLYNYLCAGLSPTKAVEKVAEENYLNDIIPCSIPAVWRYYKNLKKIQLW